MHAAFVREDLPPDQAILEPISWIVPDRPLHAEVSAVLAAGYVRGADCWHLATALYLARQAGDITFLTLDERQGAVARALGFAA